MRTCEVKRYDKMRIKEETRNNRGKTVCACASDIECEKMKHENGSYSRHCSVVRIGDELSVNVDTIN